MGTSFWRWMLVYVSISTVFYMLVPDFEPWWLEMVLNSVLTFPPALWLDGRLERRAARKLREKPYEKPL